MRKLWALTLSLSLFAHLNGQQPGLDSLNNLLQKADHDSTRSILLASIARQYLYANLDTAITIAQRGLILARNINFKAGEANCLTRMAQGYTLLGDDTRAMDLLVRALKIAEVINNRPIMAMCYGGLAGVYVNQGDIRNALFYDIKASHLSSNDDQKTTNYLNLGDDYEKLNKLDSAKYYTNLAFDMAVNGNNSAAHVTALNNLGNIFLKMKQNEVSMANYRLSYSLNDGANYAAYCETTIGMAKIFLAQGRDDSSLAYAKMSFNKARQTKFSKAIMTAGNFLAEYYRKNKNVDSAYAYLSHVIASKDSLYNEDKANQLKSLIIDETLRQQEIELNKSLAQRERHMNIQFAIIGVVLVTFVIVFFLLSRSIIVNEKWVKFLGLLALLLVFEFINLLIHPWLEAITNHSPALMLLILVCIASLLIPLHHRIEHWITHKVVAKNRVLRLAAAKRIVARLEGEDSNVQL